GFLFRALEICNQTDLQYKASRNQRLLVELALVKLARIADEKKNSDSGTGTPEEHLKESKKTESPPGVSGDNKTTVVAEEQKTDKAETAKSTAETPAQDAHKRNVVKSSGISIKDALNGNTNVVNREEEKVISREEGISEEKINKDSQAFDQNMLMKAWEDYALKFKEEKPRLYTTLSTRKPVLKENYRIEVSFHNSDQKEDFSNNVKHYLLNHLKRELKNNEISIETLLEKNEEKSRKLYTPEDKFKFLNKKNPNLGRLKQEFNLDFD
ncbi:MAG: hypothetical protein ACOCWA_09730, partial [Bacteroidota bacterium]